MNKKEFEALMERIWEGNETILRMHLDNGVKIDYWGYCCYRNYVILLDIYLSEFASIPYKEIKR